MLTSADEYRNRVVELANKKCDLERERSKLTIMRSDIMLEAIQIGILNGKNEETRNAQLVSLLSANEEYSKQLERVRILEREIAVLDANVDADLYAIRIAELGKESTRGL